MSESSQDTLVLLGVSSTKVVSAPGLGTWPATNCDLRTKVPFYDRTTSRVQPDMVFRFIIE
jgi:hypothetical protein